MKLYKLSLLTVLSILPCIPALAGTVVEKQTSLPREVVMNAIDKYFASDAARRAAKSEYGRLMNARYANSKSVLLTEKEFNIIIGQTCTAGGLNLGNATDYAKCTNFAKDIVANMGVGKGLSIALCMDGRGKNATLSNGTQLFQNIASKGLDYCHFLDSSANYYANDEKRVDAIKQYVKDTLGSHLTGISCPLTRSTSYKDIQSNQLKTIPGNPASVAFSDIKGSFTVFKCNIATDFSTLNAPSYFVFGVSSKSSSTPSKNTNNFNPDKDMCPALAPWRLIHFVQQSIILTKIDAPNCDSTLEYLRSACESYTGDSGTNCMYNHPITKRNFEKKDIGDRYMLHCDVTYDDAHTCPISNQPQSNAETTRKVGDQCATDDLPKNAVSGVYITGGAQKFDCVNAKGQSVKCACAARGCQDGYTIATNTKGLSMGYCTVQPKREIANATPIETLPMREGGSVQLQTQNDDTALRTQSSNTVENDRCILTHGHRDGTTNACLCDAELHMITMTSSSGLSYCVCDYQNGYIPSRDGKSCELTADARKKLERQQKRETTNQSQQVTNIKTTVDDGSMDFMNPLDGKLILGTEGLNTAKPKTTAPQPKQTEKPTVDVPMDIKDPLGDKLILGTESLTAFK